MKMYTVVLFVTMVSMAEHNITCINPEVYKGRTLEQVKQYDRELASVLKRALHHIRYHKAFFFITPSKSKKKAMREMVTFLNGRIEMLDGYCKELRKEFNQNRSKNRSLWCDTGNIGHDIAMNVLAFPWLLLDKGVQNAQNNKEDKMLIVMGQTKKQLQKIVTDLKKLIHR